MMKKIRDNLHYFNLSRRNPENILDGFYMFDERHPHIAEYIANTKEIKNILITIRTLQQKGENGEIIDKYFKELSGALGQFSNCSEFACFINACDSFLDFAKRDIVVLKKITQKYFDNRILNEAVPEEWIQAILDSNSSRKKGKSGEKKLLAILGGFGFQKVATWEEFLGSKKCAVEFSKIFSIKNVRKNLGIRLAAKKQNKKLDLMIKTGNKIFLCEAKHLNTSGGGQHKQISELIEIISLREREKNISYIAFLDGSYSNVILSDHAAGDKLATQRKEIKKYLQRNPHNFWVNTAGFRAMFQD